MLQLNGWVLKPLESGKRGSIERHFYEAAFASDAPRDLQLVRPLVPSFHGVVTVTHEEHSMDLLCLQLENLLSRFRHPCVLDLKIGTQSYDEEATPERRQAEIEKYPLQSVLGFRLTGMRVFNSATGSHTFYDRMFGRQLDETNVVSGFRTFFSDGDRLRTDVVQALRARVAAVLAWFESQHTYRFYSSSLLFIYEGATEAGPPTVDLRMIDFAHVFPIQEQDGVDSGYILGLKNTLNQLDELLRSSAST